MNIKQQGSNILLIVICILPFYTGNITNANHNIESKITNDITINKNINNTSLKSKKSLKKELRKRKAYHKYLVEEYNKDLSNAKILEILTQNSLEINNIVKKIDNIK